MTAPGHTPLPDRTGRPRGELRIYLGAAPGVGKTYAMLNEGKRLRDEGVDVVVGFVETHGRPETEERLAGLDVVPRRRIPYRSVVLEELDVDAILERHPAVALIDELAHTNAPGSEREKRWEDVETLRDAGIDVITTLNIQHIEELSDVIAGITGVTVRETIPDRVLESATDMHLVDLPVDDLIDRLMQGKVYPEPRARQALEHFFREGNLTALRELALRRTAAGVNERLADMMLEGTDVAPEAADRVMILLSATPEWGDVLRTGWRLASALHADLVVLAMAPDDHTSRQEDRAALGRNRELAADLGARLVDVEPCGASVEQRAAAIVDTVRAERGTVLVIGVRPANRRGWLGGGPALRELPLVDRLMVELPDVDLHLVRMDAGSGRRG
jgi:two-component system sensor histidine kinase KdpD